MNLVNMWKSIVHLSESPSHQKKSQLIVAHKLRNLQEFAQAYNLNLSNEDDIYLRTSQARRNVKRMADDLQKSIEEADKMNLGNFVAQMRGPNHRSLASARMQTFYQELLDVMPEKWKEIFEGKSK